MAFGNNPSAGIYTRESDISVRIQAASTTIGAIVGSSERGPVGVRKLLTSRKDFLDSFGIPTPATSYLHYAALQFLLEANRLYVTRMVNTDALSAGAYLSVDDLSATTPVLNLSNFDDGGSTPRGIYDAFNTVTFSPSTPGIENILGFFCAENPGKWNNNLYIRVRPSNKRGVVLPDDPYVFYVDVFENYVNIRSTPDETFLVSRDYRLDGFQQQMNIEDVINNKSRLIRYRANPYAAELVKILTTASEYLDGGTIGSPVTEGLVVQGWELYRDPEQLDVNILIQAGFPSVAVQLIMDDICQDRQDAVAILDVPSTLQAVSDAVTFRRINLNLNSSYSALYSCDLKIYDEYNDRELFIPVSGHIAACYARTDNVAETWFAPAGIDRGSLSVLDVRYVYNQGDRDALVDAQINPIRVVPRVGTVIWGADTLQSFPSALSNMNVRRLLNFVKKSISISSLIQVFENNNELLWSKMRENCERFLKPIRNGRGLYNYYVECDEKVNTPDVIANGDTILNVYLDPVIPAKRIFLNAIVTKTGAQFNESAAT